MIPTTYWHIWMRNLQPTAANNRSRACSKQQIRTAKAPGTGPAAPQRQKKTKKPNTKKNKPLPRSMPVLSDGAWPAGFPNCGILFLSRFITMYANYFAATFLCPGTHRPSAHTRMPSPVTPGFFRGPFLLYHLITFVSFGGHFEALFKPMRRPHLVLVPTFVLTSTVYILQSILWKHPYEK